MHIFNGVFETSTVPRLGVRCHSYRFMRKAAEYFAEGLVGRQWRLAGPWRKLGKGFTSFLVGDRYGCCFSTTGSSLAQSIKVLHSCTGSRFSSPGDVWKYDGISCVML